MNKIKIGKEEIEKLINDYHINRDILSSYKEDYKEVFVLGSIIYVYDTYNKSWVYSSSLMRSLSLEEGFYNYSILEKINYKLNKNKIFYIPYLDRCYIKYNKELGIWEEIYIRDNSVDRFIMLYKLHLSVEISKKEFDKILLMCELVS